MEEGTTRPNRQRQMRSGNRLGVQTTPTTPTSLLNTLGKAYELLLRPRLSSAKRNAGNLDSNQHGFQKKRSTVSAIREVVEVFQTAQAICHGARHVVLAATLNVKNAFNSVRWADILDALRAFSMPPYLLRVFEGYFWDREITFEMTDGTRTRKITAGVAQGSILGPDLWNAIYDGLPRAEMPDRCSLMGYTNDFIVVITTRTPELAQIKLEQIMRRIERCMTDYGLQLALAKTELVLLTRNRFDTIVPITVGTETLQTKSEVRYLDVMLDTKMTFWSHIQNASDEAVRKVAALSRLMPNIGGPRAGKRRLLMNTANSILLYGAEVWADALNVRKYRKRMASVQRAGAMRIASSYRTVSYAALLVIAVAGVFPIDLLARERKRMYERSAKIRRAEAAAEEHRNTYQEWQRRWNETGGRWTRRLISDLKRWTTREHGEVNFFLTQFLSGHGYFRKYLRRMGKTRTPQCKYCEYDTDDAEHTFFQCDH